MKPFARLSFITTLALLIGLIASPVSAIPGAAPSQGQHAPGSLVRFTHLSLDDGLSQNAGLAFLQDRRGYLWIGTQDGLNRYDGYTFTIYKNDPGNPDSLSFNSINALAEDRDGLLWVGTWGGGLNRFDPRTQRFTRFQHDPSKPISLSNDNVTSVAQDATGAIWIGTLGGLDRFDPQTNGFTHFRHDSNDESTLSSDGHPSYLRLVGGIYLRMGYINKALEAYERVLASYEQRFPATEAQLRDVLERLGQLYIQTQRYRKAIATYARLLTISDKPVHVRFKMAIACGLDADYKRAIQLLEEVRRERPDAAIVHSKLGWAYMLQGDVRQALSYFNQALLLDETDVFSLFELGRYYWITGDHSRASSLSERPILYPFAGTLQA